VSFKVFEGLLILALSGLALSGCSAPVVIPSSAPPESRPLPSQGTEEAPRTPTPLSPRVLASLQLTDQGRMLLERGRTDDAISLLERAVSLYPTNGENYYYLAEACLLKGNPAQAGEFNRLAGMYLEREPLWMEKVLEQRKRIEADSKRG